MYTDQITEIISNKYKSICFIYGKDVEDLVSVLVEQLDDKLQIVPKN